MGNGVMISPSILASDFGELRSTIKRLNAWKVDRIHIDVMDGNFVPNITIGPQAIAAIRDATKIQFETHLMIEKPHRYIKEFVDSGSDIIIVHCEAEGNSTRSINLIKRYGAKAGIAISPQTNFEVARSYLSRVDTFLVMGVHPGFGGQRFMQKSLSKIAQARARANDLGCDTHIAVDGGINQDNAKAVVLAGADELVVGTALFGSKNPIALIKKLRN